ncbi:hypothetical protein [Bacillus sp. B15-48]|uniref:hypothetical protein n=1 Tax=Bacillus sp. B15-48 TaxID=1548601 RepID=UPI00193FA4A1|nr:hypothetical protein [Bacillus sp. B15-48]MBM4762735.1 hypothetical protein [Bacillus sp. B15-48]
MRGKSRANLYLAARKNRVIVLEDMDFLWDEPELNELADLWERGISIKQMAYRFDREDPDEVILALLHLAREDRIRRRKGGLLLGI